MSSLEATRANRFLKQVYEKAKETIDTCGHLSGSTFKQSDLFDVSLKTLKTTFRLDSPVSSATWNAMVTVRRGEYSQRLKSAHLTRENEFISWPTPSTRDWKDSPGMALTAINADGSHRKRNDQLARAVYPTVSPQPGHLTPDWVEWLMGGPTGWTGFDSWGTE